MKRRIRRVPESAVRAMHAALIAEHGGRAGLRDAGLLSSARARPQNQRAFGAASSLFDLAAVYGLAIVKNHPFIDGNKRVALMVMYVFLDLNGYRLEAPEVDAVDAMLRLAEGELDEKTLSGWLKANSNRLKGILRRPGRRPVTIEEMNRIIQRRGRRGR